jgi:hypothetical protein
MLIAIRPGGTDVENPQLSTIERRIRMEYTEWPQLALTQGQARRLWNLPPQLCETVLSRLIVDGFLEYVDEVFCRRGLGRRRPTPRPALTQRTGRHIQSPFAAGLDRSASLRLAPGPCPAPGTVDLGDDARIPA